MHLCIDLLKQVTPPRLGYQNYLKIDWHSLKKIKYYSLLSRYCNDSIKYSANIISIYLSVYLRAQSPQPRKLKNIWFCVLCTYSFAV